MSSFLPTSFNNPMAGFGGTQNFMGTLGSGGSPASTGSASVVDLNKSLGGWDGFKGMLSNIFNSESMFGGTDTKSGMETGGWVGPALGGIGSIGNAYLGMKQYGLAKDQLSESKRQFNKQYEASKNMTNERLETRHNRRLREGVTNQSTADYMSKYGVK